MDTKLIKKEIIITSKINDLLYSKIIPCIKTICFLLFFNSIYSQDYIKKDSIKINDKTYHYTHISYGKSSLTKYFKVMTCNFNMTSKVEKEIISCNHKFKLEFTEFYILSTPNCESNSEEDRVILLELLRKIDIERMSLNLSTSLVNYKYNIEKNKFEYFINEPDKNIENYKHFKYKIRPNEICEFILK